MDYMKGIDPKLIKDLEEWEEEQPTGTRVLKKISKKSKRKRKNHD